MSQPHCEHVLPSPTFTRSVKQEAEYTPLGSNQQPSVS